MLLTLACFLTIKQTPLLVSVVSPPLDKLGVVRGDRLLEIDGKTPVFVADVTMARVSLYGNQGAKFTFDHKGTKVTAEIGGVGELLIIPDRSDEMEKKLSAALDKTDLEEVAALASLVKESDDPVFRDWLRDFEIQELGQLHQWEKMPAIISQMEGDSSYVIGAEHLTQSMSESIAHNEIWIKAADLCDKHGWKKFETQMLSLASLTSAVGESNVDKAKKFIVRALEMDKDNPAHDQQDQCQILLAMYCYLGGDFKGGSAAAHEVVDHPVGQRERKDALDLMYACDAAISFDPGAVAKLREFIAQQLHDDTYSYMPIQSFEVWIDAMQRQSKLDEAVTLLDKFIEIGTRKDWREDLVSMKLFRARAYLALGQFDKSQADVNWLLALDQSSETGQFVRVPAWIIAGDIAWQKGKYSEAETAYRSAQKAIAINVFKDPRAAFLVDERLHRNSPGISTIRGVAMSGPVETTSLSFQTGKRYALLIGSDEYKEFPHLPNPIADTESVAEELRQTYGFETTLIKNPTKDALFQAIGSYMKQDFGPSDELLIFIAGHGKFDETLLKDGMLVCADSRKDDPSFSSYVSYDTLSRMLDNLPCRHILLMMDVCFGGTFDRRVSDEQQSSRGDEDVDLSVLLSRGVKWVTRKVLTSGAKEPVLDGKPGQHSPFVRKLLEVFRTKGLSEKVLTFEDIVAPMQRLQTKAIYGDFGHFEPGSSFFFVRK